MIALVLIITYLFTLIFSLVMHKKMLVSDSMHAMEEIGEELEHSGENWSNGKALAVLLGSTSLVAMVAEVLVGAVEEAGKTLGAIIGNAAENSSAILMALRDKMDLSLSISLGSSLQIALFVAPVMLFASYFPAPHPMNLEFTLPEVFAVMLAILIVQEISSDGESNRIEGVQLLAVYMILGFCSIFA